MAGSMSSFHYAFDDKFEMMVFLYVEPDIRVERVHNRALEHFGERIREGGDMFDNHMRFLESVRNYEKDGSPNLNEQRKWMDELHCLKLELDGTDSLEGNANRIVEMWNGL